MKFFYTIFILLANMGIFAHLAIPHHHHNSAVCIDVSHCEATHDSDKKHNGEQNHSHESCVLKQAFISTDSSSDNKGKIIKSDDNYLSTFKTPCPKNNLSLSEDNSSPLPFLKTPCSRFKTGPTKLRAPPII